MLFASFSFLFSCISNNKESIGLLDDCDVIATKNVTASGDTIIVCEISSVKEPMVIPLSKLVDSLEIIRLESIDTAMINPMAIEISDNFLGVNSYRSYKLFTRKGKYIADIGRRGQGPGEYTLVYDSKIDEDNECIYLLPWASNHISVYNLKGTFIKNIPLSYFIHKGVLNIDIKKQYISIVQLPFGEGEQPLAWTQDFDGKIIHEIRSKHLDLWPDYSNEVLTQKANKLGQFTDFYLLACVPRIDSLYNYTPDKYKCIPKFTANFPGNDVPLHFYYNYSNYYVVDIVDNLTTTWNVKKRIFINKSTLKGGQFNIVIDELGGIPMDWTLPERSCFDYYVCCIEPGILRTMIEKRLSHKECVSQKEIAQLLEFNNSISEDDNNYILLGKWK